MGNILIWAIYDIDGVYVGLWEGNTAGHIVYPSHILYYATANPTNRYFAILSVSFRCVAALVPRLNRIAGVLTT